MNKLALAALLLVNLAAPSAFATGACPEGKVPAEAWEIVHLAKTAQYHEAYAALSKHIDLNSDLQRRYTITRPHNVVALHICSEKIGGDPTTGPRELEIWVGLRTFDPSAVVPLGYIRGGIEYKFGTWQSNYVRFQPE